MKHVDKDHEKAITFLQIRNFFTTELAYRQALQQSGTGQIAAILTLIDQLVAQDRSNLPPAERSQSQSNNARSRSGGNAQSPPPRQEIDES